MNIEIIPNWAWDSEDKLAFMAGDLWLTEDQFPVISRDVQVFEQNKYSETRMACTIVNGIRQWGHRFGVYFDDERIVEIVKRCADNCGYIIGKGWETKLAMEALAKYFNKYYPDKPCYYTRILLDDPLRAKVLTRWHCMGFTYEGNSKRNEEAKDGLLEGKEYIPVTYGHRTNLIYKNWPCVDDSYKVKQYNIQYLSDLMMWRKRADGTVGKNVYSWFYLWVADEKQIAPQLKKFYKRKVMLEQNIANNNEMINIAAVKTPVNCLNIGLLFDSW